MNENICNKKTVNFGIVDILNLAEQNPNGTVITSKVKELLDENGNTIRQFHLLAN